MRRYYISIVGDLLAKKIRNWGAYLHNLKKHGSADKKVLHTLEQIKDLYRNPILHEIAPDFGDGLMDQAAG
jgi:hypothetical protein